MLIPSIRSPSGEEWKSAADLAHLTFEGEEDLYRQACQLLERNLTLARDLVWGREPLPWHELGTPVGTRRAKRFDAVRPAPVDPNHFTSEPDIEDCLRCMILMPEPDAGAVDRTAWWRGRTWSLNQLDFARHLVKRQGADLAKLAAALNRLRLGQDQRERDFVARLFRYDFRAAMKLAVDLDATPPQPSALAIRQGRNTGRAGARAVAGQRKTPAPTHADVLAQFIIVARSHSPQVALRWIEQHESVFRDSPAAAATRRLFRLKPACDEKPLSNRKRESRDIDTGTFANGFLYVSKTAQRALHTCFGVSAKGRPPGKNSGQWPEFIARPMNRVLRIIKRKREREKQLAAWLMRGSSCRAIAQTQQTNAPTLGTSPQAQLTHTQWRKELEELAQGRRDRARLAREAKKKGRLHARDIAIRGRFTYVHLRKQERLRRKAVELTIRESIGADAAAAIDSARVESFRCLTGGLTRRALLLAITAETLWLGSFPSQFWTRWSSTLLADLLSFSGPGMPPAIGSRLADVATYFDCGEQKGLYAASDILEKLDTEWQLGSVRSGGLEDDIRLAKRFLKFIYCEADWSKQLPDPNLNVQSCRDHQFMITYLQVGLWAPMLRPPASP